MHFGELKGLMQSTPDEVQVNIITSACYSGRLVNSLKADNQHFQHIETGAGAHEAGWCLNRSTSARLQNTRSSQAFFLSLARFTIPGFQGQYRVLEHENAA